MEIIPDCNHCSRLMVNSDITLAEYTFGTGMDSVKSVSFFLSLNQDDCCVIAGTRLNFQSYDFFFLQHS